MGAKTGTLVEEYYELSRKVRFLSKVKIDESTGCHNWIGGTFKGKGYGQFYWGPQDGKMKSMQAHRAAWLIFKGSIPGDLMVLHRCNNRLCVNVKKHLYLGTHEQNMRDRDVAGNTSKWAHRYNFVQTPELEEKVKTMRFAGERVEDICAELNIGRTTYYRLRARGVITDDREIARANYQRAARAR